MSRERCVAICDGFFRDEFLRRNDLADPMAWVAGLGRLECGLFQDRVQFCSGLVDLVVGVRRHGGGSHGLALAGERFVGLIAKDIAEVGDRGAEFGDRRRRERTEREPGDGGRRFEASEAVEEHRESCQGETDVGDVARVVAVADAQSDVIERRQRVAVFGLKPRLNGRQRQH